MRDFTVQLTHRLGEAADVANSAASRASAKVRSPASSCVWDEGNLRVVATVIDYNDG
jgi:hypothetical protein